MARRASRTHRVVGFGVSALAVSVLAPSPAQADIGVQTLTGTVDVVAVDRDPGHPEVAPAPAPTRTVLQTRVMVSTEEGTISVPDDLGRGLRAGQRVRVTAVHRGGRFGSREATGRPTASALDGAALAALTSGPTGTAPTTAAALRSPAGRHTLTVLPVYWSGPDAQTPSSLTDLADRTTGYWSDQSAGAIRVSATVRGWARIADPAGCDPAVILDRALAAHHIAAPTTLSDHVLVYFPHRSDCGWAGLGSVTGSRIWVNGYPLLDVTAHEFGHNLGLGHANRAVCTAPGQSVATADRLPLSADCDVQAYQDSADVMGAATYASSGSLNTALADQLGLVTTLTASTSAAVDVELYPLTSVDRLRAVKIRAPSGWVYVDYRPAVAPDTRRIDWAGVQVHYLPDGDIPQSQLLDLQPWQPTAFTSTALPAHAVWLLPPDIPVAVSVVDVGATARLRVIPTASDTTAPTAGSVSYADGRLEWTPATDAGTGLAGYRVRVDGTPREFLAPSATGTTVSPLGGATSLFLDAVDAAGNVTSSANLLASGSGGTGGPGSGSGPGSDRLGSLGPPQITSPARGLVVTARSVYLTWNPPTGYVTGYQVCVDGEPVGQVLRAASTRVLVVLPPGTVRLGLAARDLAGRLGERAETTITVTTADPTRPDRAGPDARIVLDYHHSA